NIYFDIQSQIKKIILDLYSQNYITISNNKNDDFNCSLTAEGKEVLANLESSYYKKLQERINTIKTKTKYSVEGEKIIMGVKR
ncbi:ABC-three component system middle component 4, partial [Paenibacillus sp. GCM10012307]|uniref:ABC-three component system middle component 4 n=1 Tax=Paenibacillus TaxID=44249 RepID=UPI001E2E2C2D